MDGHGFVCPSMPGPLGHRGYVTPRNVTPHFVRRWSRRPPTTVLSGTGRRRGLGIRIPAARHRAFVLRYVAQGREPRPTLGEHPTLSLNRGTRGGAETQGRGYQGCR